MKAAASFSVWLSRVTLSGFSSPLSGSLLELAVLLAGCGLLQAASSRQSAMKGISRFIQVAEGTARGMRMIRDGRALINGVGLRTANYQLPITNYQLPMQGSVMPELRHLGQLVTENWLLVIRCCGLGL